MIAYIRYWQNVVNENGLHALEFNTYIISVLVIFYLQLDQKFPKLADVPPSHTKFIDHIPHFVDRERLEQLVCKFFQFYGDKFQMSEHIISVRIGRWQQRLLESKPVHFTDEEKRFNYYLHVNHLHLSKFLNRCVFRFAFRLRDGIEANAWNWKNCTMYVQDIKYPGRNITAEISEQAANNFVQMCKMFASNGSCGQTVDDYILQIDPIRIERMMSVNGSQCLDSSDSATSSFNSSVYDRSRASSISNSCSSASFPKLENVIDSKPVLQCIPSKMVALVHRTVGRCFDELKIVALLTRYLKSFDSTLKVMPFGSATYGFGASITNFNILVNAGNKKICSHTLISVNLIIIINIYANLLLTGNSGQKPYITMKSFEELLETSADIQRDFQVRSIISGDRVQKRRLPLIHNESGILCWIQFDSTFEMAKSSQIIRNYIMHDPICKQKKFQLSSVNLNAIFYFNRLPFNRLYSSLANFFE